MLTKTRPSANWMTMTNTITTEGWVLYSGEHDSTPAQLRREAFTFSDITDEEVLVEPLYGCWEGNMGHALMRKPVDICRQRGEQKVIMGNAGVVRILRTGSAVTTAKVGDVCIVFPNAISDEYGYPIKILAYDAPNTMGVLAKQSKMPQQCVIPIPENTRYSLAQWAAFSLRYCTAWANWQITYNCWRTQMPEIAPSDIHVWGWGGGVSLAELDLASRMGCQTAMVASSDERLSQIEAMGIRPIDRRAFPDLNFDPRRYKQDKAYKSRYLASERTFLDMVDKYTNGRKVSIFIDNVGAAVFRATLKALARQGAITTCGWKEGMNLSLFRAIEAINRHMHLHTHFARYSEGVEAVRAAEELEWMAPPIKDKVYGWSEIPQLAEDYESGFIKSYFPIFAINE